MIMLKLVFVFCITDYRDFTIKTIIIYLFFSSWLFVAALTYYAGFHLSFIIIFIWNSLSKHSRRSSLSCDISHIPGTKVSEQIYEVVMILYTLVDQKMDGDLW